MNSKFKSLGVLAAILILGIGGVVVYALAQNGNDDGHSESSTMHDHSKGNHHGEEAAVEASEVKISNFAYSPESIKVKVGTKVTWTNEDSVKHTVTSEKGGDMIMDSELLAKGESYSVTFTKAGTYPYFCKPHTYMKATVVVTE